MKLLKCHKLRINSQGYDSSGNYWGVGYPLYHCELEDEEECRDKYYRFYLRNEAILRCIIECQVKDDNVKCRLSKDDRVTLGLVKWGTK